jgi:WhiB family redox-sensing transcriptional regulator
MSSTAGWVARGACRGQDAGLFFPRAGEMLARHQVVRAKAVCARCPVLAECLSYALGAPEECGIWGGATVEERRAIQSRRRAAIARAGRAAQDARAG